MTSRSHSKTPKSQSSRSRRSHRFDATTSRINNREEYVDEEIRSPYIDNVLIEARIESERTSYVSDTELATLLSKNVVNSGFAKAANFVSSLTSSFPGKHNNFLMTIYKEIMLKRLESTLDDKTLSHFIKTRGLKFSVVEEELKKRNMTRMKALLAAGLSQDSATGFNLTLQDLKRYPKASLIWNDSLNSMKEQPGGLTGKSSLLSRLAPWAVAAWGIYKSVQIISSLGEN